MEEVFDKLEIGLEAFEKLVICSLNLPKYNLKKDLETIYHQKENAIVKDFIEWGVNFVKTHQSVDLSQVSNDSTATGNQSDSIEDNNMSKVDSNIKVEEAVKEAVGESVEEAVEEDVVKDVEKDQSKKKKRKKTNKEYRQKRLLKFHEKLVETSGLPPSRLMKKQKHNLLRRNLADEFNQIGGGFDASPISSKFLTEPAPSAPWTGGCCGGEMVTLGWPEARPVLEIGKFTHLYCGSTSGFTNQPSLSPSSQYSVVWPVSVPVMNQQQPMVPPSPAYCFHCMQYGSVFTVSPV